MFGVWFERVRPRKYQDQNDQRPLHGVIGQKGEKGWTLSWNFSLNLIYKLKFFYFDQKKSEHDYYLSEFSQSYKLPDELKLEDLKSKLTDEGILTMEAQLPKLELEGAQQGKKIAQKKKEKEILIEHCDSTVTKEAEKQEQENQDKKVSQNIKEGVPL